MMEHSDGWFVEAGHAWGSAYVQHRRLAIGDDIGKICFQVAFTGIENRQRLGLRFKASHATSAFLQQNLIRRFTVDWISTYVNDSRQSQRSKKFNNILHKGLVRRRPTQLEQFESRPSRRQRVAHNPQSITRHFLASNSM